MEEKVISSEITDRVVTEEQLLELYNISLEDWDVEKKVINTWEVGTKGPDGNMVTTPLFQVKVWLRNKQPSKDLDQIRKEFIEDLKKLSPTVSKKDYGLGKSTSKHLLEINIFDLHIGKIAWDEETGQTYNLETACELYTDCIEDFIANTKHMSIDRILLPVGNDFFNSDKAHPYNSTTKGTPQDEDARWQKTFRTGRELLVKSITRLAEVAPVDVVMIPGNHDFERNFYLGDSLEGWFINNENVSIDNTATPRKYYRYHELMLGFTHGDGEKVTDLPLIMAQENPVWWGATTYREFHLGHIHHKREIKYKSAQEYQGVIVRYMSSLSATDAWHHKKGYVGSKRSAEALVWDAEKGLKAQFTFVA